MISLNYGVFIAKRLTLASLPLFAAHLISFVQGAYLRRSFQPALKLSLVTETA